MATSSISSAMPCAMTARATSSPPSPIDSTTPGSTTYVPIIAEVEVKSNGNPCQDIKSEATLVKRNDVSLDLVPPPEGVVDALPTGKQNGRFRAFAVIDPAAEVTTPKPPMEGNGARRHADRTPQPSAPSSTKGIGPQRWGWYKQYLLAYLDGGNIPLQVINPMGKLRAAPRTCLCPAPPCSGIPRPRCSEEDAVAGPGIGPDVMEHRRGEEGYSPICRVWTFDPADTMNPEKKVADIQNRRTPASTSIAASSTELTPSTQSASL